MNIIHIVKLIPQTHEFIMSTALTPPRREKKRGEYHRRRAFVGDGDIDYINDRNMVFNKKLDRFYAKHTREIRENLERGTAL